MLALHHSRFYTGMTDPIPGNSGMAKCPDSWESGNREPGMDILGRGVRGDAP